MNEFCRFARGNLDLVADNARYRVLREDDLRKIQTEAVRLVVEYPQIIFLARIAGNAGETACISIIGVAALQINA